MKRIRCTSSGKGDIVSQNIGGKTEQNISQSYKFLNIKNHYNDNRKQTNNIIIKNEHKNITYNKNIDNRKIVVNNIKIVKRSTAEINYENECNSNYIYMKSEIRKAIGYAKRNDINETFEYLKGIQIKGRKLKTQQYMELKNDLDEAFEILKDRKHLTKQKQIQYKSEKCKEQNSNYKIFKQKITEITPEIKYNTNFRYLKDKLKSLDLRGYIFTNNDYIEIKKEIENLWFVLKEREYKYKK